ncbi:MAG: cytochrome c biogenesis protein CcdA [Candidatus Diapherotrites archaeon]|uniref:Cytochrome c biogenesis protein CcdA n=1 Tax=Candidatus Iainarchaeum sp. TaxID=3101447 RepID=A0A8T3YJR3_9ARCH|nr:cytochrome c biogenesis protein CcdA [Candidatus Diapherotrites archaeon]
MILEFFAASILAAFLSGAVAFFAPCCITFLLPAYFAFALKEKKQILKMTLIFTLGLATILIPIGIGLAGLGQLATQFHKEIFIAGGLFMLLLGIFTLVGRTLSMPFKPKAPSMEKMDAITVYQLGLFSGFASSCCLPVLAGVLTLSLISASFVQAFFLGWAYVLGMVIPLVALALLWDKYNLSENPLVKGKNFSLRLLGKNIELHSTSILSGAILTIIGAFTLIAAFTNKITAATSEQIAFAMWLQSLQGKALQAAKIIPDWVFFALLIIGTLYLYRKVTAKKEVEK